MTPAAALLRLIHSLRLRLSLRAGVGLAVVGWLCLAVWVVGDLVAARERELAVARRAAGNLSTVLVGHLEASIDKLDVGLLDIAARYPTLADTPAARPRIETELAHYLDMFPEAATFLVADRDGNVRYVAARREFNGRVNLANRPYFERLRDDDVAGLVFGGPLYSRLRRDDWVVVLARRLVDARGQFDGIVLAGLHSEYFERFFASLDVGANGTVTLATAERRLFARWPARHDWREQPLPASPLDARLAAGEVTGHFDAPDPEDGSAQLVTFRAVEHQPFVFTIAQERSDVLAGWHGRAFTYAALGGVVTLALLIMLRLWQRGLQQAGALARQMTDAYLTKERESHALLDAIPAPAWLVDAEGRFLACNAALRRHALNPTGEVLGRGDEVFPPVLARVMREERQHVVAAGRTLSSEHRLDFGAGPQVYEFVGAPVVDENGRQTALAGVAWDVTARYRAEERRRLITQVFDHSSEAIVILDAAQRIVDVNAAFVALTGYPPAQARGIEFSTLAAESLGAEVFADIAGHLVIGDTWRGETRLRSREGEERPVWCSIGVTRDDDGRPVNYIVMITDLTVRKANEQRIDSLAYVDPLTLLPNRRGFARILEQWLQAGRHGALLVLDLDQLSRINDAFGHEVGDRLLGEMGQRLGRLLAADDALGRVGGDQFGLITATTATEALDAMGRAVLDAIAQPLTLGTGDVVSTACMGICRFPEDGTRIATLLRNADAAMHHAKDRGGNTMCFFADSMSLEMAERLRLESELRGALAGRQLELHYQPQLCVKHGRVVGVESLLRWRHPELGLIPPGRFIPLAEETRLILPIGAWVIEEACRQAVAWQAAGLPPFLVAVNLSALQLHGDDIVAVVARALEASGLAPRWLELEITESAVMTEPERVVSLLGQLKQLGVRLSIDDFGTGYSSLSYLKRFPVDKIKIDQSFVRDLATNAEDAAIVRMVIGIAAELQHRVIAEGVENREQLDFLRRHRCHEYQGYLCSRPLPPAELATLVADIGVAAPESPAPAG